MLNISDNSILKKVDTSQLQAFRRNNLPKANRLMTWWLIVSLILTIIIFFLPWTQNVQMKGRITTLLPEQRPQDVNTTIGGRIEKWYVREGNLVEAGDTIVYLSEVKTEYFDPQLVDRTAGQVTAKKGAISSYGAKVNALDDQIAALTRELVQKKDQLQNKIQQAEFKQETFEAAVQQAEADLAIARFQFLRYDTLYQKGIKSLSDLEEKRLKRQEKEAKWVAAKNKLRESSSEINIAKSQYAAIENEYADKIAKAKSNKFTTQSDRYEAEGSLNKLNNQYQNYIRRNEMYYIVAPQTGYVTKAIKSGIGEMIKEGETIVTIVPLERELAVEMYLRPMDLPLINLGQEVRLVFDGWQAFIISGWTNLSFGTYSGEVVALDNIPNEKHLYRILVKSNNEEMPFPDLLRVGSGAQGIALLNDVPVWYEIWRQLNGFPADFYEADLDRSQLKDKAPVKSIAK